MQLILGNNVASKILSYSDKLSSFDFGPGHPFLPARAKQLMDLLSRYSLVYEEDQQIVPPQPLDEELLYLFHTKRYIELLKKAELGEISPEMLEAGLGTEDCPIVKGMFDFCLTASGGTHQGALMLLRDEVRVVFNPVGGFHHAGSANAEGFCYINDLAIAIADLVRKGRRVAYIDTDVHFGNGVRDAFHDSPDVLTISIHESGATLYPWSGFPDDIGTGKGRGYNANIPLLQGSDDEVFLYAFESIVPPLVAAFKPDILVAEIGADTHRDDPLGHLNLTSNGYEQSIRMIREMSPKILATGGGGYNMYKTAGLWTLAWAALCGLEPHDAFAGLIGGMMYGPEAQSGTLRDDPYTVTGPLKEQCMDGAREVVEYLKKNLFPIHGI